MHIESIAEIAETGKHLKTILWTHAHPDHYFGLGLLRTPSRPAQVTALASVARTINRQFFGKLESLGKGYRSTNVCRKTVNIEPLSQNHIELEGKQIEIIPEVMGDSNTIQWSGFLP